MKYVYFSITALLVILSGCSNKEKKTLGAIDHTIEMDSLFCSKLLPDMGGGVTGADGAISIDLKDGRSMFMWGDSFFGDVVDGIRQEPISFMMGNVFTVIDEDDRIVNYYKGDKKDPTSYIEPEKKGDVPTWYWPGHGFVRDGVLHLFMSQFHKEGEGSFAFAYDRCDYFTLDSETLAVLTKNNFAAATQNGVHYGHAVLDEGDYIYIYGTVSDNEKMTADVHVARSRLVNKQLSDFDYWNGSEWDQNATKSKKIAGISQAVSEQFNVVKLRNKYVLVTQDRYKNAKNIYSFSSDLPQGPFGKERLIFTIDEPNWKIDSMMAYNTMVHPQYIKNDKVLMCYNVNTHDLEKVWTKASVYRPRFFWMPISNMLD